MNRSDRLLATSAAGLLWLAGSLIVTGWLLHVPYSPTVTGAHSAVSAIYGHWFWNALGRFHEAGSAALIIFSSLHVLGMVLAGWYKPPQLTRWYSGVILLVCALLFQITGHLLPFDRHAVQTAAIEGSVAERVPVVGARVREIILQGAEVGQGTLDAWYLVHRWILPILLVLGVAAGIAAGRKEKELKPSRVAMFVPLLAAVVWAVLVAPGFGSAPTTEDFASYDSRPNWYTLPLHGLLKMFDRMGAGWIGVAVMPGLLILFLLIAPLLAKKVTAAVIQLIFDVFVGVFFVAALAFGGSVAPITGNQDPPSYAEPIVMEKPRDIDTTLANQGEGLFKEKGCSGCHTIDTYKGRGGPSLNEIWKRRQDPAWYGKFIRNPSSIKPGTIMPAFPNLSNDELRALAEYLRKGR